jgi:hypothetical protein
VSVDDDQGDGDTPDTFDDRLTDIRRLVGALTAETDVGRRQLHRFVIVRELALLAAGALQQIAAVLDELDELDDMGDV